jgi:hypothetical protein
MTFRAWYFVHNVVAHPLLALWPFGTAAVRFHDWTAERMERVGREEAARQQPPISRCTAGDEDDACDGRWHTCWNCGGSGYVETTDWQDDDDEEVCSVCRGATGWPCPDAAEAGA